ncbi:MAG: hypothetical protein KBF88_14000, partial [Polyangiaceae bacterium]|nr:hypothetical protein [Polyangiaceae bacterium]
MGSLASSNPELDKAAPAIYCSTIPAAAPVAREYKRGEENESTDLRSRLGDAMSEDLGNNERPTSIAKPKFHASEPKKLGRYIVLGVILVA